MKSELVERLNHLAELRVKSLVGAEKKAQEHAQKAKHYSEAETDYRKGLNDDMLRLEKINPVGPRTEVPLISDARLRQDIESGRPIWQARRAHRARERAAQHRLEEAQRRAGERKHGSVLLDVSPEEAGGVLDEAFHDSARQNLKEFRTLLKEEANKSVGFRKRQPDSEKRKKFKKQKRKERKGNCRDDADRDRNHAIAHSGRSPEASFSPGIVGLTALAALPTASGERILEESAEDLMEVWVFDVVTGAIFDIVLLMAILASLWMVWAGISYGCQSWQNHPHRRSPGSGPKPAVEKVGGSRRKVRFNLPRKGRGAPVKAETPFLGGPRAAKKHHPPGKPLRLASAREA